VLFGLCAARGPQLLYTSSSLTSLMLFASVVAFLCARYEVIELEGTMNHLLARQLQARESRLQMLQRVTMDERGNSVLSDDVTLESLGMCFAFWPVNTLWVEVSANGYITSFCLASLTTQRKV